ncbi:rab11 family-interacting protein 4A isoform X1 [Maylandia zebra]|uniref:Rab11 family-interacting protein 4A n=3 Tax=Haplochromini TaxID=319058 RepID=A0A9Y3RPU8_9CICH|nr:rab11 family-interacting protein 4A isoform X1 [Maylandia zebra]XP_005747352.1 PREDICTED: rab11 family-interacting protein 4A-like [Pundamilia nyererei]XP_026021734.1 rab11 family-interacting protein 4A-like isoform X1 [Astatotilapia calliptera]XP_039905127.1 rab11 family-interacting protein 4A isoform X1 [Simochromis diagramma]
MEGRAFPEQEQLLQFLRRLKEVFDVCDEDADGFIRVEHLMDLGLQFGQGDEVKKLTRYLDPNAHGKINFKDFCHGVFAIKGCEEIMKMTVGPRSHASSQPSVTDNGYIYQNGEAKLGPPIIMCTRSYQESTCADGECDMDSSTENGNSSDSLHPTRQRSRLIGSASAPVISREEQFEDYGEGEDVDFTPSSPCPEEETRTNGFSDLGSSLPSSAGHTPQKMRQLYNSELLDIYCSQCCKKVNLLNDLEARLRNLKANSPNRKISSTAFGRQLFQANHSVFGSSQGSSTEDLFTDSIDSCDLDITEKVSYLEKKVTELESDSLANNDLKSKLKHDNTHLVHRVHELEEQVKDAETKSAESLKEEVKKHREAYTKMERDRNTEIELLCNRLQQLEEENTEMKLNVCRLKSQTEKMDQEKQRVTDKLEDTSLRLKDEMDLYRKIMDKLWQNRHEFQKEKESMQELIDDLRRELEYLQLFKLEMEHPGKGKGLSEFNAKTREMEMEHEVKRLKQENHKLRDQNDDLNAQILSLSLYEAKNLFSCQTKAQCLAAEIDNASRDELVDALKEQEEINLRLRQYMDKIILAILDHNPSILEIKN